MINRQLLVLLVASLLGCKFAESGVMQESDDPEIRAIFAENAPVMDPDEMLTSLRSLEAKYSVIGKDLDAVEKNRLEMIHMFANMYVDQAGIEGRECDFSELDFLLSRVDERKFPNLVNYLNHFKQKRAVKCQEVEY